MSAEVACSHCGLQYETREMISVNGFYGCAGCFNEFAERRATPKQIRRRPGRRTGESYVAREAGQHHDEVGA